MAATRTREAGRTPEDTDPRPARPKRRRRSRDIGTVARQASQSAVLEREVAGVPLRVPAVALLAALAMLPVGLFLAGLGILALQASGGAAHDTSLVVMVAAFAVTDFWGGSVVHALTRRNARDVTAAWVAVRAVLLGLVLLATSGMLAVTLVQLALAGPAAWLGVRVGAKQASLRAAA